MRVRWTTPARRSFAAAGEYVAERNPAAAVRMVDLILDQTAALADFPRRGRPGRVDGTRELVIAGTPYVVAYRIRDDVEIVGFLHARQQWPKRF